MLRRAASIGGGGGYAVGPCTESLGSESGDVGCGDAEIDQLPAAGADAAGADEGWEVEVEQHQAASASSLPEKRQRRLPPPMPRAAEAFMRAERRGGRLILTEVRVVEQRRREVFRASRAGGRLRLRFANEDDSPDGEPDAGGGNNGAAGGVVGGGCCNGGAGEFCHQVAAVSGRRVEISAVMGI